MGYANWHARITVAAVRAGKDVYLQKPASPCLRLEHHLHAHGMHDHALSLRPGADGV